MRLSVRRAATSLLRVIFIHISQSPIFFAGIIRVNAPPLICLPKNASPGYGANPDAGRGIIGRSPPGRGRRHSNNGGSGCGDIHHVRVNCPCRIHPPRCQGQESHYSRRGRISSRRKGGSILSFESFDHSTHLHLQGPIKCLFIRIHDLMAWREFTFVAGSGFILHAKKKCVAFPMHESSFYPFPSLKTFGNMGTN